MKCVGIVIAVASMLFVAMPAQATTIPVGQQLIVNGGMEMPAIAGATPDGWTKSGGPFECYESSAHSGSWGVSAYSGGGRISRTSSPTGSHPM